MERFWIKEGSTLPLIKATLKDAAGQPITITSGAITFHMRDAFGNVKINGAPGSVTNDGTDGKMDYHFTISDTDTPATYEAEFQVVFEDGEIMRAPIDDYITVVVVPALD